MCYIFVYIHMHVYMSFIKNFFNQCNFFTMLCFCCTTMHISFLILVICWFISHLFLCCLMLLCISTYSESLTHSRWRSSRTSYAAAAAAAKSLQSCPTLCDPRDSSPPGSPSLGFSRQNTGVGCHFHLQCMKVKSESEVAQSCPTLSDHGLQPTRLLRPWDFPGKSTGLGCHCLLWNQL